MLTLKAKPLIERNRSLLKEKTDALLQTFGRTPHLAVILIGKDPSSQIYIQHKEKAASAVGFTHESFVFEEHTPPAKVFEHVQKLNEDSEVDGILIQRPLPKGFSENEVVFWVTPEKDVDCLHPENIGLLVTGNPRFNPCTPEGVLMLLDFYNIEIKGKTACVIGRSSIVGKPLASMLLGRNASVIQIHRATPNPQELCRMADLVFVAAGSKELLKKDWIKPGAVVIDVGIHRREDGSITGDVDVASISEIASALSPVPGGVGPMTIQVLLENTFKATLNHA